LPGGHFLSAGFPQHSLNGRGLIQCSGFQIALGAYEFFTNERDVRLSKAKVLLPPGQSHGRITAQVHHLFMVYPVRAYFYLFHLQLFRGGQLSDTCITD